uniref:Hemicentin-1 n=1 Tax=Panagrellus redivivus TaxID=6233 RepID=A0A7E4VNW9_PANRE
MLGSILVLVVGVVGFALANPCPVCGPTVGTWSGWSEWGLCSQQYGAYSQQRTRTCSTGSSNCYGADSESIACVVQRDPVPSPPAVAPEWNSWGSWSGCSASCDGGFQYRQRTCNTQCGVCTCVGPVTDQQTCNLQPCCTWQDWSPWSECSVTCGSGGVRYRTRQCSCGNCGAGETSQQQSCSSPTTCPTTCNVCQNPPPPPPPPPTCNICNQPPPPCSACGYYGRRKRRQALTQRKIANGHVDMTA